MLQLLKLNNFTEADLSHTARGYAKWFQRIQMRDLCRTYHHRHNFCEIGPHNYFEILKDYAGKKYVVDPYNGAEGAGMDAVPNELPYPIGLFRCMFGVDSDIIPDDLFDFSFTVSVIEHIGQAEVGYDCQPVENPPEIQEKPRDAFCRELFRTTRPGGLTIHSVDHAARNRTYLKNFLDAGFELLDQDTLPSLQDCLCAPDLVRQRHAWLDPSQPMSDDEQKLHSVLTMGFVKPR